MRKKKKQQYHKLCTVRHRCTIVGTTRRKAWTIHLHAQIRHSAVLAAKNTRTKQLPSPGSLETSTQLGTIKPEEIVPDNLLR